MENMPVCEMKQRSGHGLFWPSESPRRETLRRLNPNFNSFSNPCSNFSAANEPSGDPVDEAYGQFMEAVVGDSIAYINYNEVAGWLDRYRVYRDLDMDSLLRYSDPSLLNFYDTLSTGNIGLLRATEKAIDLLYDSSTHADNFAARYQAAWDANNSVSSGEDWEDYEKVVNEAMILLTQNPPDSLPHALKEEIGMIAHLCPYVGGHATRKARTLYLYWQPNAIWDDRVICLQGQNKGSTASVSDLDSMYMAQVRENNHGENLNSDAVKSEMITGQSETNIDDDVSVYPNPAQNYIIVQTKDATPGNFTLYNSLGEVVLTSSMQAGPTTTYIPLLDLAAGIYHYDIEFANRLKKIGKLSIIK